MKRKLTLACEQKRRKKALVEFICLATTIQARNQDLTAVAAKELADRFTREVILEMMAEGKIKYVQRYHKPSS